MPQVPAPPIESNIQQALNKLFQSLDELQVNVEALPDRLHQILVPNEPMKDIPGVTSSSIQSPHANTIDAATEKVRHLINQLHFLNNHIEL